MSTFKKRIIISIISIIGVCILSLGLSEKKYSYTVNIGGENIVEAYLGQGNYFYKDLGYDIEPLRYFPEFYYRFLSVDTMGRGEQGSSLTKKYLDFPDGVMLYWYAPYEDAMWIAKYPFDQKIIERFKNYQFYDVIDGEDRIFFDSSRNINFVVNIGSEGRAAIWLNMWGESYLLGLIQGFKGGFDQWSYYRVSGLEGKTREEIVLNLLEDRPEEFRQQFKDGTLDKSAKNWDRQMKRYQWDIVGNEHFKIKDFFGYYANGEQYYRYENKPHAFYTDHAVPIEFIVFVESLDEKKQYERLRIKLDRYEVLEAFEKLFQINQDEPLSFKLSLTRDLKEISIYVKNKKNIFEVKNIKASLQDI